MSHVRYITLRRVYTTERNSSEWSEICSFCATFKYALVCTRFILLYTHARTRTITRRTPATPSTVYLAARSFPCNSRAAAAAADTLYTHAHKHRADAAAADSRSRGRGRV